MNLISYENNLMYIITMETKEHKIWSFLLSATALDEFLAAWQAGTLPHSQWTHAAHVAVAACYAFELAPADALLRTRRGIIHFNNCVGTPNTDTRGYHETLTRLWCEIIGDFVRAGNFHSRLAAASAAVERYGQDRNRHRLYYSFDVATDVNARRNWVRPDRSPL
jgi:hypothetical protein